MTKNLSQFSEPIQIIDFNSLFTLTRLSLNGSDDNLIDFLSSELANTRFHFDSLETTFQTFAEIQGVSPNVAAAAWKIVKESVMNFRNSEPNYAEICTLLIKAGIQPDEADSILQTAKKVLNTSKRSLNANVNPEIKFDKKLGTMGELMAFLYSTDLKSDCVFHKIVPDNPGVHRHGMDLLTIKFDDRTDDMVHFWEAKGTLDNFSGQCRDIVDWFSGPGSYSRISMVIEAAKIHWSEIYPAEKFRRASRALSRFQAEVNNFLYIGCVTYESSARPSDSNIAIFDKVSVGKGNKQLVLIGTKELKKVVEEVYLRACRI